MTVFEMVKYHSQEYPANIPLRIEEVAAHFDITQVTGPLDWSLHTEYSYGKRKLNSNLLSQFPEIIDAQRDGIPQLWKNELWAQQFSDFIIQLAGTTKAPKVIEIHPPFSDYSRIPTFINIYRRFEDRIKSNFPHVQILIENRYGSIYHGGRFIVSKLPEVISLCNEIEKANLSLMIAYDVPQIYTAHNAKTMKAYQDLLTETRSIRNLIGGVHLWGKRISETGRKIAHCGDLSSYFGNEDIKEAFLCSFKDCFGDGVARKMVLEVNSGNDDLQSIIMDLRSHDVIFL